MLADPVSVDLGVMQRTTALVAILPPLKGAYIVDLGCGEREVARALATLGARVSGYDPFIGSAHERWIAHGAGEYRLARASAEAVPEPDESTDAVLFVYSLHHVPQAKLAAALREAHRILKPSGRLCVIEPIAVGPGQHVMEPYHDETSVRANAKAALVDHVAPVFVSETVMTFQERTSFADFEAYAARAMLGARFNDYRVEQVTSPEVRRRFAEMMALNEGTFDQPVRINLFTGRRAQFGGVERIRAHS